MSNPFQSISINVGRSIIGFEHLSEFILQSLSDSEDSPYFILKSVDDPTVEFVVISPFHFYPQYEIKLSVELQETLQVQTYEEVLILNILTIHQPFEKSTVNLLAPLVVNISSSIGRQFIPSGQEYVVNAPLFPSKNGGR
ncbi:flagellar assembly protein FliW [Paenibacillus sp. GCM10023252]|uniref:flagellar assembly protein FliW n=1 Tax=Paenibacillus sp. GCM10023252 TaxID=3252649 RepID=UPI0036098B77